MKKKRDKTRQGVPVVIRPEADLLPVADGSLIEQCRTRWQQGAWHELAALDQTRLAQDPDRAIIALLVAAAHQHLGRDDMARDLAQKAVAWGADPGQAARLLLSALTNSLGRASLCLNEGERAREHFETAVELIEPRADVRRLAQTRRLHEMGNLGFVAEAVAAFDESLQAQMQDAAAAMSIEDLAREMAWLRERVVEDERSRTLSLSLPPSGGAESRRGNVGAMTGAAPSIAFVPERNPRYSADAQRWLGAQDDVVIVELKSMPRAGLHYAESAVAAVMGDDTSFCEWYQEPGCCRLMPCAHGCFMPPPAEGRLHLRLTKSHDFDLADPCHAPGPSLRRLILVRDPLYVLTSWWTLDLLARHRKHLEEIGINPVSLFYKHNKALLKAAYRRLDTVALDCAPGSVARWIAPKARYLAGFARKWTMDTNRRTGPWQEVVAYDDVPDRIAALIGGFEARLGKSQRQRLDAYGAARAAPFRPRQNPFAGPTDHISAALDMARASFETAAERLCAEDETGTFARASAARRQSAQPRSITEGSRP